MKNNVLVKGILLLIVLAVLTMGIAGCGTTIISTTPTYYASRIYIESWDGIYGDVYLDSSWIGYLYPWNYVTAYNVSYGSHTVSVYQSGWWYYYTINVSYTGQTSYISWY
jgi:hypothetical protein